MLKQIKIIAEDNIRINAWAITKDENGPRDNEWQILQSVTPNLDVTSEITENGTYYVWIQDTAGNTATQVVEINKIDTTPPQIAYTINQDNLSAGYVTINVTAQDADSGLYGSPFSWDKNTWSQENSTRTVKQNGRYKVYAVDNLGNIGELEILVDCFPQIGTYQLGEGNIITDMTVSADWNGNTNNHVQITLNKDLDITAWQITTSIYAPNDFVEVEPNVVPDNNNNNNTTNTINTSLPNNVIWDNTVQTNTEVSNEEQNTQAVVPRTEPIVLTTSLDINTTYYFWIKDSNGNTSYQTFTIAKAKI